MSPTNTTGDGGDASFRDIPIYTGTDSVLELQLWEIRITRALKSKGLGATISTENYVATAKTPAEKVLFEQNEATAFHIITSKVNQKVLNALKDVPTSYEFFKRVKKDFRDVSWFSGNSANTEIITLKFDETKQRLREFIVQLEALFQEKIRCKILVH